MKYILISVFLMVFLKLDVLSQTKEPHSLDSISITYIANTGFLVEMNDAKIVFDGFFMEGLGKYDCPDSSMIFQMKNNLPPFNNIDYMFVSHNHADHVEASLIIEYLTNNSQTKLFCPIMKSIQTNLQHTLIMLLQQR